MDEEEGEVLVQAEVDEIREELRGAGVEVEPLGLGIGHVVGVHEEGRVIGILDACLKALTQAALDVSRQ
jgi:hypothetical protein